MPTTAEQRMHQNEWLAALRMAERQGYGFVGSRSEPYCALGHARYLGDLSDWFYAAMDWLGISEDLAHAIYESNDANEYRHMNLLYRQPPRSLPEIADWFKEQRDLYDGDLSQWTPAL